MPRARRRNGEDIGLGRGQRVASLPARPRRPEVEAISASLRDLTDFAHGFVEKPRNIFIFLRLSSSPRAKSLQTSSAELMGPDPRRQTPKSHRLPHQAGGARAPAPHPPRPPPLT